VVIGPTLAQQLRVIPIGAHDDERDGMISATDAPTGTALNGGRVSRRPPPRRGIARFARRGPPPRAVPPRLAAVCALVLGIACLYWARNIFVPLALAMLLAFLLNPLVVHVRRTGLPRAPAIGLVVLLSLSLAVGVGWVLFNQVTVLADDLPRYRASIEKRIDDIQRARRGGALDKMERTAADVAKQLEAGERRGAGDRKPIPVVVSSPSAFWRIPDALEVLVTAGLVVVLLLFMLSQRRELLARIVRLFGANRLAQATRALEEAGERISSYLVMYSAVNGAFGAVIVGGLFLLGVPFALLWGVFAAVLRFVPYVGAWIAASVPIALSFLIFEGWMKPLLVIGLYVVSEAIVAFVVEPLAYSRSAGVSEIALLLAAAFWAWLWGPLGLLLSTPLTVCLVVIARNVSGLEFLALLLGDDSGVPRHIIYYQRLLAGDEVEAADLASEGVRATSVEAVFDGMLVPALARARRDREAGRLTPDEYGRILAATETLLPRLMALAPAPARPAPDGAAIEATAAGPPVAIAACPVGDEADRIALAMLAYLLGDRAEVRAGPVGGLVAEALAFVQEAAPSLICVGSLAGGGAGRVRHLVKRLRAGAPEVPILVGRWGAARAAVDRRDLWGAGASEVASSLAEARAEIARLAQPSPAGLDPPARGRVP